MKEGKKEGRKEGRKEIKKEGRKQRSKEGRVGFSFGIDFREHLWLVGGSAFGGLGVQNIAKC